MCFSAQASFTAAGIIAILGSFSLKKAKSRAILPLASIPLFFALQQCLEGIIWLTINTDKTILYNASVYGFLFFAGVFWPLWVPWSLWRIESIQTRKNLLFSTLIMGAISIVFSFIDVTYTGITAKIINHNISYQATTPNKFFELWSTEIIESAIYATATIIPFFISTALLIWFAGILIAAGFIIAHIFYYCSFASVWCFFAALASGAICLVVAKHEKN